MKFHPKHYQIILDKFMKLLTSISVPSHLLLSPIMLLSLLIIYRCLWIKANKLPRIKNKFLRKSKSKRSFVTLNKISSVSFNAWKKCSKDKSLLPMRLKRWGWRKQFWSMTASPKALVLNHLKFLIFLAMVHLEKYSNAVERNLIKFTPWKSLKRLSYIEINI